MVAPVAGGLRLTASFGTGVRAPPSRTILLSLFLQSALRPGALPSAELGIDGSRGEGVVAHTFENRVND